MNTEHLSIARKRIYWLVAGLLLVLIVWLFVTLLKNLLASANWVELVRDVDHRMTPERFKDVNSDGIRAPEEADTVRREDFNVIFLGDSYIHGFILSYKLAPPKKLQNKMRVRFQREDINVWNFGWTTSSPILQLRLLQDIGKKYQPDLVILSLDMTDYKDDYVYRQLIEKNGLYGAAHRFPRLVYLFKEFCKSIDGLTGCHRHLFGYSGDLAYFVASQPLAENRFLFDGLVRTLKEMNEYVATELEVPFVVFVPPRHWQYTDKESPNSWDKGSYEVMGPYALENYRYFDEVRQQLSFPVISLLEDFQQSGVFPTTFDKDSHWNKHGAQLMADRVFVHLRRLGYFAELEVDEGE